MGAEMDRLEIAVEAQASKANQQLDMLIGRLSKVSNALRGVGNGEISGMADGVQKLSSATKSFKGANVAKIEEVSKAIKKLTNIDVAKMNQISGGMTKIAGSLTALNTVNIKDTGITNLVNSLNRLTKIDTTKFTALNAADFSHITGSISALANMPDVSGNANRFVSSLARLTNAGNNAAIVTSTLPRLGNELLSVVSKMARARDISDSVNLFTQSIGRLASAGNKTIQTATGLDVLANETLKFFQAMTKAPRISRNTLRMTEALAQLATAGGKVGTSGNAVESAFNKMQNASDSANSTMQRTSTGIVSAFRNIGNSSRQINNATFSLRGLLKAILPIMGIRQLFNWGKQAAEISSDLTEMQNVVDVTFGDFKDKIEDFTKTSIQDFGMSELTAKQIGSRFQAMGVAMGFTQGKMSDMSVELTKLAADMASFYNVEQKDVAKALESVFTGQTRPLRTYGLDLTQATVQEWAMKQGIDAKMSSMTQAEKTMLRYQYVLANTTAAQGDFAATANTWANQTRILKQNFEILGATIGNVLIGTFKPLVSWLNTVMLKVNSVAKTIGDALGAIFGWTFEITPAGITEDVDDIADGMDDIASGADDTEKNIKKANDNAKKLKNTILGFDELNVLNDISDSASGSSGGSGSGSGSSGGSGSTGGASTQLVRKDSILEKYKSEIKNLEQLGEFIGNKLTRAMQGINWNKVYASARNFGKGLADFLNGLISPELFGETGRMVANSLNTALYALDSFGITFKWDNFGNSLATGLNRFFRSFKFAKLANTLNTWAHGLAVSAESFLTQTDWNMIGNKISYLIRHIDWLGMLRDTGKLIWQAINSGIKFWKGLFGIKDIESSINGISVDLKLDKLSSAISGLGSALGPFTKGFGQGFADFIDLIVNKIAPATIDAVTKGLEFLDKVLERIDPAILEAAGKALGTIAGSLVAYNGLALVGGIAKSLGSGLGSLFGVFASNNLFAIAAGVTAVAFGLNSLSRSGFFDSGDAKRIVSESDKVIAKAKEIKDSAVEAYNAVAGEYSDVDNEYTTLRGYADAYFELSRKINRTKAEEEALQNYQDILETKIPGFMEVIGNTKSWDDQKQAIDDLIDSQEEYYKQLAKQDETKQYYQSMFDLQIEHEELVKKLNEAYDEWGNEVNNASGIIGFFKGLLSGTTSTCEAYKKQIEENEKAQAELTTQHETANRVFEETCRTIGKTSEETGNLTQSTNDASTAMSNAHDGANSWKSVVGDVGASAEDASGKTVALADSTGNLGDKAAAISGSVAGAVSGLEELGGAAKDANDKTGGTAGALSALNGMDIRTSMKMAIISAAIGMAGREAGFSQEQMDALIDEICSIDLTKPGQSFSDITDLMEKAGISADGFKEALIKSAKQFGHEIPGEFDKVTKAAEGLSTNLGKSSKSGGENWISGFINTLNGKLKDVSAAMTELVNKYLHGTFISLTDMHSPSRVAQGYGQNWDLGLAGGITGYADRVMAAVNALLTKIKAIFPASNSVFNGFGASYMDQMQSGMISRQSNLARAAQDIISTIRNAFGGLASTMYDAGHNAAQSFANGFKSVYIPTPHMYTSSWTRHDVGNSWFYTPNFGVSWYASGGFPQMGELFMANEKGPEMVGKMGNRNAVANNNQITEGIARAVAPAVYEAVLTAMAESSRNGGGEVHIHLEGDAQQMFRVVRQKGLDFQQQTGKPVFG